MLVASNMNRFLSKREKIGTHKREKSREKAGAVDRKKILHVSLPMSSIFAAFSNPHGKGVPVAETTCHTIHATTANDRPGFLLQIRPLSSDGLFSMFKSDPQKKMDKELSNKIQKIRDRLAQHGYSSIGDEQITYSLSSRHADGDADRAFEMLLLFQESVEGIIKPYDSSVQMQGAENREGVTCYLDALLFAMFSRLGSFEPILYNNFEDEPRRRLSTLIRLWVNLLRTGKLIQTDVTGHLQDAMAACGWEDAGKLEQQDTSEAFHFITEKLELPLLTLKMDIYHTGKVDDRDDHKFVQERLLEVAVPEDTDNTRQIKLEDCLERYFNNRVEVVRRLERSNTRSSVRSASSPFTEKEESQHIEVSEMPWGPDTPTSVHAPAAPIAPKIHNPLPTLNRNGSIIRHRIIHEDEKNGEKSGHDRNETPDSVRRGSLRKEVLMPAWQFFNLIPWYTKHSPANDAEVAAHFSQTRPVLGICLKRYAMTNDGQATRKDTFIDIPLDIKLPHFIQEDMISEDGPLMGNFKLSLQSVICHRGTSVHSGHYISFIRGATQAADGDIGSSRRLSNNMHPPHYAEDRWIKFDDLADPRVQYVDIEKAMVEEMPYLLFYQVQPTYEMTPSRCPDILPPSYTSPTIGVTCSSPRLAARKERMQDGYFDGANDHSNRLSSETEVQDEPRISINMSEERRGSILTDMSLTSSKSTQMTSAPVTPGAVTPTGEETTGQRMSRAAARFKTTNKSRPTSAAGEGRLSLTLSRLNWRASKEQLISKTEGTKEIVEKENVSSPEAQEPNATDEVHITMDEENTPKLKKSKKRDKSRGPGEVVDPEHENHHHDRSKGKAKEKDKTKDIDRECSVM
ncbi:hypothetical protein HYALB_00004457 [Hymenoscyphus albidus]|uniref:ubiquitinyl hydrolase 1 n=1 Tax=Hymenoscyphus albidus TaxID=595503 RepID=A0A9N9LJG7_9HELO|nr:hypothetical protein HYALB_00004457 [Hymenoscyphus albidus]